MRWTTGNTLWAVAATGAIWTDCLTTRAYLRQDPQHIEGNPFLGDRPSEGFLNTVCLASTAATLVVAWAVPTKARKWVLGGVVAVEVIVVVSNLSRR